jgi:hypothetical protein
MDFAALPVWCEDDAMVLHSRCMDFAARHDTAAS